jgi:hypothetical protein
MVVADLVTIAIGAFEEYRKIPPEALNLSIYTTGIAVSFYRGLVRVRRSVKEDIEKAKSINENIEMDEFLLDLDTNTIPRLMQGFVGITYGVAEYALGYGLLHVF